jgi:flagellar biosynthetic protein FlhB
MAGSGDKTEQPTPKRLEDARRKGQIAQSRDLTQAAALGAAIAATMGSAAHIAGEIIALMARALGDAARPSPAHAARILDDGLSTALLAPLPVLVAVAAAGALVAFLQTRGVFTMDPLAPKLERISPAAGFRRLFAVKSLVEIGKALLKITLVLVIGLAILRRYLPDLVRTPEARPGAALDLAAFVAARLAWTVAAVFAGIAVLDALYQRWLHHKELRMTKQEVKDEHKQMEGDPQHRAQRQRAHREIANEAMIADVRRAKVVIVNPEHIAIALDYDEDSDDERAAPRVIAKGEEALARRIIEVAREAGVPVIRNVPLAQALSRVELGEEIPEELYETVAEVLQFVARIAEGKTP